MKLTQKQQRILDCLASDWLMLQSYDFPITLQGPFWWLGESCPKPTKDKLIALGLIEYTESSSNKFYTLTDEGRKLAHKINLDTYIVGNNPDDEE